MCEEMEEVTSHEFRDLAVKVDAIDSWKKKIAGALAMLIFLFATVGGICLFFGKRGLDAQDRGLEQLTQLNTGFQVMQAEVAPFVKAGPRFTQNHFDRGMETHAIVQKAWVREYVEGELDDYPPQWLRDQVDALQRSDESFARRLEALEREIHIRNDDP
jgi:hypothetical protein